MTTCGGVAGVCEFVRTAAVIISGLALLQYLRRGHYELATEAPRPLRVVTAFAELAQAI